MTQAKPNTRGYIDAPGADQDPIIVIGTRAQLIKMAPVLRELESNGTNFKLLFTGQHLVTMDKLLVDFGVQTQPQWLGKRSEIDTMGKMLPWFVTSLWRLAWQYRHLLRGQRESRRLVVVHGDTLSTLLGAIAGRLNRCLVAHVESGLRSFNLRDPFPEEVTRILVFRLAQVAFCPGKWAASNARKSNVEVVDTGSNTLLDAVRYAASQAAERQPPTNRPYCVVSIHRHENLSSTERLDWILDTVVDMAREYFVEFVLHPSTRTRLQRTGKISRLNDQPRIKTRNRMGYLEFTGLISGAEFVVTDGGSNQEELSYLGVPTLITRERSERLEGLGANAELLSLKDSVPWRATLNEIRHRETKGTLETLNFSPSAVIAAWIADRTGVEEHG